MEKPGYTIVLLGAGNVAWHLAPALQAAGHRVKLVYNRTLANAREIAQHLPQARVTDNPDLRAEPADLFLIAVKDAALPQLLAQVRFPENSLVAHTSGTVPLSVFEQNPAVRPAVFYPLQTFSKNTPVAFSEIPFCLECPDANAMLLLRETALSLSPSVYEISSEQRKVLHLGAVFASNFTNHLLGISHQILQTGGLDFNLLQPLVKQTVAKAFQSRQPFAVQTGPAVRHDEATLQTQMAALQTEPGYRQLYEILSRSIQQQQR